MLPSTFEANHNKDYSVVKTFIVVPPNGGIAVLKVAVISRSAVKSLYQLCSFLIKIQAKSWILIPPT